MSGALAGALVDIEGDGGMHWTERRERYRAVLAGDACIHPGSVFDPISARIAEDLGFEVGMFAGRSLAMRCWARPISSC